jgi:hypothetical protein
LRRACSGGYNDEAMSDLEKQQERARNLEQQVREAFAEIDPDAKLEVRLRPDGKFDLHLVSTKFEGMGSTEREALFWSRIRRLPSSVTIRMTYALLLSPAEAETYFDE